MRAREWRRSREPDNPSSPVPQTLNKVPQDLLNTVERKLAFEPIWIRTNYGPGTDARFAELVKAHDDADQIYFEIMNDSERYDLTDLRELFAFFPALLESVDPEYLDAEVSFDSDLVQSRLFGDPKFHKMGIAEEDLHGSVQMYFFVADSEAMRTGLVQWIIPDQYGVPLLSERVQPFSLRDLLHTRIEYTLEEFRQHVREGWYGNGLGHSKYAVGPWNRMVNEPEGTLQEYRVEENASRSTMRSPKTGI